MISILRRWWTNKYKLPWTHKLFQEATEFELLVEYHEDLFEDDPRSALLAAKGEDGEIILEETGDELIDKWERELAMGLDPDLTEGLSEDERQKLEVEKAKAKHTRTALQQLEEEDFDAARYASKTVIRGSAEELEIMNRGMLGRGQVDTRALEQLLGRRK